MGKLDSLVQDFNKKYKEEIAAKGIKRIETQKIPFSSPRLNYMLYGGLPRGRLIEFAGEEGGGKTTSALDAAANAQYMFREEWEKELQELEAIQKPTKEQQTRITYLKNRGPKQVVYADCENTLDEDWAALIGVDVSSMYILRPQSQSAEEIFEMLLNMIETDEVGLVVIDSFGVMLSAQAYEKTIEEKTYGGIAAALTLFSKKAVMLCQKTGTTLIGINQMREDMNSPYSAFKTTGGKAWKHNCSVRLMFQKGAFLDSNGAEMKRSADEPKGNQVMVSVAKTKVCKPDRRTGFYTLKYDTGIDALTDLVETALRYGIINQSGSWFNFVDLDTGEIMQDANGETIKVQGKLGVVDMLDDDDIFRDIIEQKVMKLIQAE